MSEPVRLFSDQQPGPEAEHIGPELVNMAKAVAAICATRSLLMIATLTGAGIWGFTVAQPSMDRLLAAGAFSIVFVLPLVALYMRKG